MQAKAKCLEICFVEIANTCLISSLKITPKSILRPFFSKNHQNFPLHNFGELVSKPNIVHSMRITSFTSLIKLRIGFVEDMVGMLFIVLKETLFYSKLPRLKHKSDSYEICF